jgi:hypothetical protein
VVGRGGTLFEGPDSVASGSSGVRSRGSMACRPWSRALSGAVGVCTVVCARERLAGADAGIFWWTAAALGVSCGHPTLVRLEDKRRPDVSQELPVEART